MSATLPVSAKRNFSYFLLPSVVIGVGGFFVVPITTYYLDPMDFGIFAIVSALAVPVSALTTIGSTLVYTAHYLRISDDHRRILLFNLLIAEGVLRLFGAALAWVAAPYLLPIVIREFDPVFVRYFQFLLVAFLANAVWVVISGYLVLHRAARTHARFEVIQWASGIVATLVALAIFRLGVAALFIGPLVGNTITACTGLWFLRSHCTPKLERRWLHEVWSVGIPSVAAGSFEAVANVFDRYFLQRWSTLAVLGAYGFSQSFRGMFTTGLKAFNRTYVPYLHETLVRGTRQDDARRMLRWWYGVVGICGVGVTFFARDVIAVLTHGKFTVVAPLVPLWFLLIPVMSFGTSYVQYLFLERRNTVVAWLRIFIGTIAIGVTALAVWWYGIVGATVAAVVSNFVVQLAYRMYARRIGCPAIGERTFIVTIGAILLAYAISFWFVPSFAARAVIFLTMLVAAGTLAWRYGGLAVLHSLRFQNGDARENATVEAS